MNCWKCGCTGLLPMQAFLIRQHDSKWSSTLDDVWLNDNHATLRDCGCIGTLAQYLDLQSLDNVLFVDFDNQLLSPASEPNSYITWWFTTKDRSKLGVLVILQMIVFTCVDQFIRNSYIMTKRFGGASFLYVNRILFRASINWKRESIVCQYVYKWRDTSLNIAEVNDLRLEVKHPTKFLLPQQEERITVTTWWFRVSWENGTISILGKLLYIKKSTKMIVVKSSTTYIVYVLDCWRNHRVLSRFFACTVYRIHST